jgi:hypothetical protein
MYRALGFAHATVHHQLAQVRRRLLEEEDGQGTVEYVGLILLIAGIMAAVVALKSSGTDVGRTIVDKLKQSIDGVGDAPGKK